MKPPTALPRMATTASIGLNLPAAAPVAVMPRAATKPAAAHKSCSARKSREVLLIPACASRRVVAPGDGFSLPNAAMPSRNTGRSIRPSGPKGVGLASAGTKSRDSRFWDFNCGSMRSVRVVARIGGDLKMTSHRPVPRTSPQTTAAGAVSIIRAPAHPGAVPRSSA
jgi:hypothetical protein